jgi:hypothetical protein
MEESSLKQVLLMAGTGLFHRAAMAQVPLMLQVRRQHGQQLEIAVLVSTGLPRQPAD